MEIPEHLHELVDQLGKALVQAVASDEISRSLAKKIQNEGFEVALMIEATVALHKRDEMENPTPDSVVLSQESEAALVSWSDEDRAFLRTFKIAID
ncbi:MAG: hypothetical protein Q8O00_12285 [Holophaga sp.]|nr:hypothetical protein [Holophaga sp.]